MWALGLRRIDSTKEFHKLRMEYSDMRFCHIPDLSIRNLYEIQGEDFGIIFYAEPETRHPRKSPDQMYYATIARFPYIML